MKTLRKIAGGGLLPPFAGKAGTNEQKQNPSARRGLLFLREDSLLRRKNGVRVNPWNRRRLLLLQLRMGERFARHHRLPLAGVVEEDRLEHRALLQIERMQAIVGVHVRVMRRVS
jgi:hypothetical protein